jgi:uncharacterized DUF497 family protein
MLDLSQPCQFDWDEGNFKKNLIRHGIECREAEEAFSDENSLLKDDIKHSLSEKKYYLVAKGNTNKLLTLVFTVRKNKIRIISARVANKKERSAYEQN